MLGKYLMRLRGSSSQYSWTWWESGIGKRRMRVCEIPGRQRSVQQPQQNCAPLPLGVMVTSQNECTGPGLGAELSVPEDGLQRDVNVASDHLQLSKQHRRSSGALLLHFAQCCGGAELFPV